jgi:RNA polymerase sigma factor (sigma-70 family)
MAVSEEFARLTDPFRPELLAHCYRMLGSVHDAEDQVQETMIRAWRSYGDFEGRASLRTWLHRIATNACLRALENSSRRPLPSGLGGPSEYPEAPPAPARPEVPWLQPIPDALVSVESAEIVASRQSVRLALIAALQYLPARQRAVLILRDVLRWRAAEVADLAADPARAFRDRAGQLLDAWPNPGHQRQVIEIAGCPLAANVMAAAAALEVAVHGWDISRAFGQSASRREEEWAVWFAGHPSRTFWLLAFKEEPAGMVSYDLKPGGEVEIETFGLLPEFVGKGQGGFALTLGVQQAWELAPSVNRIWLHTSTLDHPRALPNYHRQGFRTFKTEEGERS